MCCEIGIESKNILLVGFLSFKILSFIIFDIYIDLKHFNIYIDYIFI